MADASEPIRVLHVEDDAKFAELTAQFLERHEDRISVEQVARADAALDRLAEGGIDCVVSDYDMPGADGIAFLRAVREERPELPFLLFTGKGSETVASEAISAGVTDYLRKDTDSSVYEVLANRVANAVDRARAERAAARAERRFQALYNSDLIFGAVLSPDGAVESVNDTVAATMGVDEPDLLGAPFHEMPWWFDDDDAATVREHVARATAGETARYRVRFRLDGDRHTAVGLLIPVAPNGGVEAILSLGHDVTRWARHLAAALDAFDGPFFILDGDGRLVEWNETAAAVTGRDDDALDSASVDDLVADADLDRVVAAIDEVVTTGSATVRARLVTADGGAVPHEFHACRLALPDRDEPGIVGFGTDLSDRLARERRFDGLADRLSSVATLADDDLREALAEADARLDRVASPARDGNADDLARLRESVDRAAALVDDIARRARTDDPGANGADRDGDAGADEPRH